MATIRQQDFIQSVADALQHISYYHPVDYITNLARAYELEQSPAAKDAIAQILINSRHVSGDGWYRSADASPASRGSRLDVKSWSEPGLSERVCSGP